MPEVLVNTLSFALQKQVESARAAFDRGKAAQAAELCARILEEQPACLSVRKLERPACSSSTRRREPTWDTERSRREGLLSNSFRFARAVPRSSHA